MKTHTKYYHKDKTMDKKTTIEELKKQVKKFCEDRNWDQFHNPKDLAIGIATEAGELLERFRFKSDHDMDALMNSDAKNAVEEELADILYFVLRFAQMNDIDLSDALTKKIRKNDEKYPIEKAKDCNKKYDEY